MNLTSPESLIFWTSLIFIVFFLLMRKLAWKPILGAVKSREDSINNALLAAENAKKDMQNLKADNEKLLAEARAERDIMIKEAREIKEKMISDAKSEAQMQGEKMIEQAKASIASEKNAAIADLKNQVGALSIEIAEKVLKGELANKEAQTKLVETMLGDAKLN
ncbi:F0F1 ATP synthase subunit B [uncultured Flavobacterium sp.]|uniref:F0F1 ATP synthase subunit B n=1 Tax=uncultured Flavobacterium sp. TaxID=165435 RepID=UPI0030EEE7C0|tara:strand:- start:7267 stop:7758 length:492 start_codon:yes stop_codon:yes gene_type:complete